MVNSILERYKNIYRDNGGDTCDLEHYSIQSLCRRLHNIFDEYVLKIAADGKRGTALYKNSGISVGEAISKAQELGYFRKDIVRNCASILRNEILSLERTPLDNNLNVDSIMKGEVTSPDLLKEFYRNLYTGSVSVTEVTSRKTRLIESSCADALYACSGSKLLPGKHLSLALAVKSLTGSHTAVTLLNRFGHCASNETIRRIDMAIEETVHKGDNDFVPKGIRKIPGVCTGTAWDNFDSNIETLSGLGTIHHTYGICYQNESNVSQDSTISFTCTLGSDEKGIRFKRVKSVETIELEPCWKKVKMTTLNFDNIAFPPPSCHSYARSLDTLWSLAKVYFNETIPMWTEWNSLHVVDENPKQTVCYMDHIQQPATRLDVVKETLKRSQSVSKACGEEFTLITYDLAVAKIAKQLQCAESPTFDDIFIMFGSFHIE